MGSILGKRIVDLKVYWKIRKSLQRYRLFYSSKKYELKDRAKTSLLDLGALFRTLKTTVKSLMIAGVISGLLFQANNIFAPLLVAAGWKVPDDGDYVTFLSAVAGIGGVFIGLYYAALTSVGSAIYAKVPNSIRLLLAKERSGSVYMRYLSTLTLICVILIACRVVGLPRLIVAVPLIAVLAGVGIVAFVKLGRTAFNLFDPTALSHHVFEDFNKAVLIVMAGSPHWTDPSFQHHARKIAWDSLETLRLLLDITIREVHQNGRPLTRLTCQILIFLSAYEGFKKKIPSDSHWYPQRYKHRDWYSTVGHTVMIAHKTGTKLQPDMTRSQHWVEKHLHPDILRTLEITVAQGKYSDAITLISHLNLYIDTLVACGSLNKAFDFANEVSDTVMASIKVQAPMSPKLKDLEVLSIVETIASLPVTIALSLTKHVELKNLQSLTESLDAISWKSRKSLYSIDLPVYLLPQGEWLFSRLAIESRAEGRMISPRWYLQDIMNLGFSKVVADLISSFTSRAIEFYTRLSEEFSGHETRWLKACVHSSEYEFWHKAERTQNALTQSWQALMDARSLVDPPWPSIETVEITKAVAERRNKLIVSIAGQAKLLLTETAEEFPDYSGQFCFITGEAFLDSLCKNDTDLSNAIFQTYMLACIARFERLKPPVGVAAGLEDSFRIAGACLLDLMELSGYAILLSEFHQNKALWEPIQSAWSALSAGPAGKTIMAYLALVIHLNGGGFGLPLRAELRFEWERIIWRLFAQLEVKPASEHFGMVTESRFVHPSPLIKSINFRQLDRLPSGYDLFIVTWYVQAIKPQEFKLNWQQEQLFEAINPGKTDDDGVDS